VHRFDGQLSVFDAGRHRGECPCYRCLFPEPPPAEAAPNCAEAGVLGVLPGVVGLLQATEAIKLLLGIGEVPLGKLTCYDALRSSFRTLTLRRDPACKLCGDQPSIDSIRNPETLASTSCAMNPELPAISAEELKRRLDSGFEGMLVDVREPDEYAAASIPGSCLIPLGSFEDSITELPRDREILIHCKSGRRSARAVQSLLDAGFSNVLNVTGGIDAWHKLP